MKTDLKILLFVICMFALSETKFQELKRVKRIVGGIAAAIPPEDDPLVIASRNNRYAEIYGEKDADTNFYMFRGIRYGQPPVGARRFQRPKEMPLEGEIRATRWGSPCPQIGGDDIVIGHEDCLFLNIFVPELPDTTDKKFPVLFWIHGGNFKRGSASQYDMKNLVKKDTVVVSIQYRFGTLGFLSTGSQDFPGNNGIFDIMLAAKWVQKYIEFFGGDPKQIVAFGHGTGASSAMMLAVSKLNHDLFNGLIAMSGSSISHFAFDKDPLSTAKNIASLNNCPVKDVLEMVRCLRELPVEQLVKVDFEVETQEKLEGFTSSMTKMLGPGPVVEGHDDDRFLPNFVSENPENSLSHGEFPKIPLLTGVVKDETAGATFGPYAEEIEKKLTEDPNFLTSHLVPKLQRIIPIFDNATKYFVPEAFSKYLNVFGKAKPTLGKVAEALVDAIFNIPAYLMAKYWSKKSKILFYSFEHKRRTRKGRKFLSGSPMVDNRGTAEDKTDHGDDLQYIFGQNDVLGEKIVDDSSFDKEDEEVMENYTDMIAQFARSGSYNFTNDDGQSVSAVPFSEENNNYISIGRTSKMMDGFRYCEIGLWTGLTERLQSPICNILKTTLKTVDSISEGSVQVVKKVDKKVEDVIKSVPGFRMLRSEKMLSEKKKLLNIFPEFG